jgi:plasminogen activator inhibitor 1 RNA-binding protein
VEARKVEQDESLWKGAKELIKTEEDAYFVGKTKGAPKTRTRKEEKVYLEIDARFERPNTRGGRGRGDRGGGEFRGGSTRDRGRSQRSNGNTYGGLNVADETAFPSLSGGA